MAVAVMEVGKMRVPMRYVRVAVSMSVRFARRIARRVVMLMMYVMRMTVFVDGLAVDVFVVVLGFITLKYPLIALGLSAALLLMMALAARWIWRRLRRRADVLPA